MYGSGRASQQPGLDPRARPPGPGPAGRPAANAARIHPSAAFPARRPTGARHGAPGPDARSMTTAPPSPGKRLAFTAIMLAIPLAAVLAAIAAFGWQATAPYVDLDMRIVGDHDIAFDPVAGFVRPPHATTRRVHKRIDYTIHTDRLGARVDEPGVETPARVAILTVGCSFSEGHGMANADTYTSVLGRSLGVPVANFAVGSYSGVQAALALERHRDLRPRVVVYGLIEDHLRRNLDPCARSFFPNCLRVPTIVGLDGGEPSFTRVEAADLAGVQLTADLLELPRHPSLWNRSWLGLRTAWHEYRDWREASVREAQARINDANALAGELYVVRRMAAQARALDATLVVLHMGRLDGLPATDRTRGWRPLPDGFVEALPADVVFVDATGPVARHYARSAKPLYLTRSDDHPNARAHGLFAKLLEREIVARGLLAPKQES